ncbi:hypothetical protein BsIDN1_15670 [Bacillus safensis]|uniref:Uncharacterized protein n=1 Tax=Bacillus safensis TaxID=561879 RepID=A0A5S9M7N3_BACIA|nr:hypothetical protein BsIDN1_15670 [Bacillus safensis]
MASVVLPVDRLGVITSIPRFLLSGFNGLSLMFGIILMILSIEVYKKNEKIIRADNDLFSRRFCVYFVKGV